MKLSVLIPVYDERYLVEDLVQRVLEVELPEEMDRELVIVDDGSTDGTREILDRLAAEHPDAIRYIPHERNLGKGGAIRTAIEEATGDFCIFQDADLEYDPQDYPHLLAPLLAGKADVVYGSRYLPLSRRRVQHFGHFLGNRLLTLLSNLATNLNLTDMETCYKVFRTEILRSIPIRSDSFALEPEITAKVAKRGLRVYEVPINYDGRTYAEGKKIGLRDGFLALFTILRYWLIDDIYEERTGAQILSNLSRAHRFNEWMADTLRPHVGDRVLEVGAGIGTLAGRVLPRELYVAADPEEVHLAVLRDLAERQPRMEVARIHGPRAEDYEPWIGRVDTVLCLNVLEHIPEARATLENFHRVLEPGGRAVVLVPQGPWLYSSLDETLGHLRRYTRDELGRLLEECGFELERVFDFNRVGVVGWWLNGRVLRRGRMPRVQLKAYDSLVWLWRWIDRFLPWKGLSVVAVGRKKA